MVWKNVSVADFLFWRIKMKQLTRLSMLKEAQRLAYKQIAMGSCLTDGRYAEMLKLPEEEAIETLAREFLQEAVDYNFGE